jgi:DNA polymerase-3 subunit delta'
MKFSEIIGHEALKKRLINNVKEQRVSHAQLFYGPSGTGKLALALAYAQYVSCVNKQENDSCGECPSCKKYQKLIHPDLHFVFPVVSQQGKLSISDSYIAKWREKILDNPYFTYESWLDFIGAENKQGSIYKDEAKEVLHKLNLKTFEAEFKVMIIWLPEKMNQTVANKLLKIIEEPPQKTLFILVSDHREEILQTIISRTQPVKVARLKDEDIIKALCEKTKIEINHAEAISKLSGGNFILALSHVKASESRKRNFDFFVKLMRLAYQRNVLELLKWVKDISDEGREKQKAFLSYCLVMLRENFIMGQGVDNLNMMLTDESDFAQKFSAFITSNNIFDLVDAFEKAHYHIVRNVSARMVFTDLFFIIMDLLRKK